MSGTFGLTFTGGSAHCPASVVTLGAGGTSVATTLSSLGCGLPGVAPKLLGQGRASGTVGSSERGRDRNSSDGFLRCGKRSSYFMI